MHIISVNVGLPREVDWKGKRVSTFQLVSEPRRLPPPNGLCNLETGPETFQIVTSSDAQAAQLRRAVGEPDREPGLGTALTSHDSCETVAPDQGSDDFARIERCEEVACRHAHEKGGGHPFGCRPPFREATRR